MDGGGGGGLKFTSRHDAIIPSALPMMPIFSSYLSIALVIEQMDFCLDRHRMCLEGFGFTTQTLLFWNDYIVFRFYLIFGWA